MCGDDTDAWRSGVHNVLANAVGMNCGCSL
jgi:hypothetical protein